MKVVLVNPSLSIDSDNTSGEKTRFFPEGLAAVAAALLHVGHEVQVVDICAQQQLTPEVCKDADVFGITGMINQFADLEVIIPHLRELNPKAKLMLGGPLVTCAPELIRQFLDFDIAVIGEGEKTVVELLQDKHLINSKGRSAVGDDKPRIVSATSYLNPEDFILPAFKLFDLSWYISGINRSHLRAVGMSGGIINNMMVSRGCPRLKNCGFCGQFFGHAIRCKPTHLVWQEMKMWTDAGASAIRFQDDNLTLLSAEMQEEIYGLVSSLGLRWAGHSRVDAVNLSKLKRMKKAGCKVLYLGIESFSNQALSFADKGTTAAKAVNAVNMTLEAGIRPAAFFLLGLPGETRESLQAVVRFVRDYRILVTPYILCPIPGTPLFELARLQIPDIRDYLRHCSNWENRQLAEGKLYINLTDLPDELLLETYKELKELGK
ncbi:MAG: radical SAM protein [bacterium]